MTDFLTVGAEELEVSVMITRKKRKVEKNQRNSTFNKSVRKGDDAVFFVNLKHNFESQW